MHFIASMIPPNPFELGKYIAGFMTVSLNLAKGVFDAVYNGLVALFTTIA